MPNITIPALRQIIIHNGVSYPIFLCTAAASTLRQISLVPRFSPTDSQSTLATRLWEPLYAPANGLISTGAGPPGQTVAELTNYWQRPSDMERIQDITSFYLGSDQIMSNPLLFSVQDPIDPAVNIEIEQIGDPGDDVVGDSKFVLVKIQYPNNPQGSTRPLIVIDGQHRLEGMGSNGALGTEQLPFVLLYDDTGAGLYSGKYQAETFTMVTTTAKDLSQPHKDWMRFTFGLKPFHPIEDINRRKAYETVLFLCKTSTWGGGEPNSIFYDRIRFNTSPSATVSWGYLDSDGLALDATKLSNFILKQYYEIGGALPPQELARALSNAMAALAATDVNAGTSSRLFPGPARPGAGYSGGLEPVYTGVIQGILTYMSSPSTGYGAQNPPPPVPISRVQWNTAISDANLNGLDWTFTGAYSISGTDISGSYSGWSRDIMRQCIAFYLRKRNPATPSTNFIEYIWGRDARIELVATPSSANNTPLWGRRALGFPAIHKNGYSIGWPIPASKVHTSTAGPFNLQGGGPVPGGVSRDCLVLSHNQSKEGYAFSSTPNLRIKPTRGMRYWVGAIPPGGGGATVVGSSANKAKGVYFGGLAAGTNIWIEVDIISFSRGTERKFIHRVQR
jgi:hypothetical protein